MSRRFPKRQPFLERERAAIPDPLAIELCDMTAEDSAGDGELSGGLAELELDASAWQQTPVGLYQCAAGGEVYDMGRTPRA